MKRNLSLFLIAFIFAMFLSIPVFAQDFEGVEFSLQEVEAKIRANDKNNQITDDLQKLFPDWSEDEIYNYFELLKLNAVDIWLTQNMVAKYGTQSEIVLPSRLYFEATGNVSSYFIVNTAGLYILSKNMKCRKEFFLALAVLQYMCLETHRVNGRGPYVQMSPPTFTIIRIKF